MIVSWQSAGINQKWLCNTSMAVRAVVLLSLQLFGVNSVSELLLWQDQDCNHFHVFYK